MVFSYKTAIWPFLFLIIPDVNSSRYVPGTPGAPWGTADLKAVKGHLLWILQNNVKALDQVPAGPVSALGGAMVSGRDIYQR